MIDINVLRTLKIFIFNLNTAKFTMSFDKCFQLCNHHHNEDAEQFHYTKNTKKNFLVLPFCNQTNLYPYIYQPLICSFSLQFCLFQNVI